MNNSWEQVIDAYGRIEGFLCKCGHQSNSASNYCPNCGERKTRIYGQTASKRKKDTDNAVLKITVDRGRENDFIIYCNVNGIYCKQFPKPISWSFRVEIYEYLIEELLGVLDYIKIEPMPTAIIN